MGGKYKTLSGVIAVTDESTKLHTSSLFISADDNSIYSTGEIDRAFVPSEISVNVEGCQWLKFYIVGSQINWSGFSEQLQFILYNWKLE